MENVIQGNDAIIELNQGGVYTPFVCVKSFSLETNAELVETTTLTTGKYRDYELQSLDYTVNLATLLIINSVNASGKWLYEQQLAGAKFAYRITYTDTAANAYTITGIAIVQSSLLGVNSGDLVTGDFTMKGCGSYNVSGGSSEIPGTEEFSGLYEALGGEDYFADVNLIDSSPIEIMRNGISMIIIETGTPGTNTALFDSVLGRISFGSGMELATGEYIQYIFRK